MQHAEIELLLGREMPHTGHKRLPQRPIIQIESTETKLLAAMQLQAASHQRADTLERMSDEVLRASLIEMRSHFLDGWPGLEEGGN